MKTVIKIDKNDVSKLIKQLVELDKLSTSHYKVILYLMCEKDATQSQIATSLGVRRQNMYKTFKDLKSMDIISLSRIEGNNNYWKLNLSPNFQINGQQKLDI